jgi:alanine or glycine:cation symporter, AGCS family
MNIDAQIAWISSWIAGVPLLLFVVGVSIICTVAFGFIQFRSFFKAWRVVLAPSKSAVAGQMTPFQAFVNTLSASIGNGSIAGVATAVYAGGPGSAFWIVFFGFILMAVRFAEVYASSWYGAQKKNGDTNNGLGGPMLYLKDVMGGRFLAPLYAFSCVLFGLTVGNAVQTNSIALSMHTTWGISPLIVALVVLAFVAYILFGGASRIIAASDTIVPVKVGVFFVSATMVLLYHYAAVPGALALIIRSAFSSSAFVGGVAGFSVLSAIQYGMQRSVMATESGLGTVAILFGFTGNTNPTNSAFMGMIGTFVSTVVCFLVALCIVASGVWHSGLTSTSLTIASYSTVFGVYGGWIVSFLSVAFGIGVLVAYAYITRAAFLYLTNNRWNSVFVVLYCAAAFFGSLTTATTIFAAADIPQAALLFINLFGLLCLLPRLRKSLFNNQIENVHYGRP